MQKSLHMQSGDYAINWNIPQLDFNCCQKHFTLSQLQQTYEIILGEALDKRNFRRRILDAGVIEATSYKRSDGGRPARLYRYRDDAVAEVKTRRLFP